ncbi:MAG TPA: beta-propeller fold lactonase family protein [Solirubrobacteraceae bacterium]|jgi:6-phosphogluconolactonase (cycloisomerase 2 family)|nr:beta-propeller fold lactonase family protein [Solirubrobacteraceae bacterium]
MSSNAGPYVVLARAAGLLGLLGIGAVVLLSGGGTSGGPSRFAGTVYVESNSSAPGQNRVLAFSYRTGSARPAAVVSYATGGSGSHDLSNSGVLDADQQLIVNPTRTLLFAVNQGSDTVAVFHVAPDGTLSPVAGSPFPSGGSAPGSVGLWGDTLIVANKAQDGVRALSRVPASYTTFAVGSDGTLIPTGTTVSVPARSSPTQAFVTPRDGVLVSTEETGLLRTFLLGPGGSLTPGAGSPFQLPTSIFPGQVRRHPVWPAGLSAHPKLPLIYSGVPNLSEVVVYSYDAQGRLTFVAGLPDRGSFLPCWSVVSPDGRRLYTADAGSDSVSVFDIAADPLAPRQVQLLKLRGDGNPWNMGLTPDGRYLFVVTPRAVAQIPPGQGNTLHMLDVDPSGRLSEPSSSPVSLPVSIGTNPLGLAIVANPVHG